MRRLICMLALGLTFSPVLNAQEVDTRHPLSLAQAGIEKCVLRQGHRGNQVQDYQCLAVGELMLSPQGSGIGFSVQARADAQTKLRLPGQAGFWPQDITVDGQSAVLRHEGGNWFVILSPGAHRIEGHWGGTSERVNLGDTYARVIWQPENRELSYKQGFAWLQADRTEEPVQQQDTTPKVRVWRRLDDGQIPWLTTEVEINLTGPTQKLNFGPILPKGFVATNWTSDLPMVMTPDNSLVIVGGQGSHQLSITAACQDCQVGEGGKISGLELPKIATPWPEQETWSVVEQREFRAISVGGHGIDPAMAQVPQQWQAHPAYRVSAQDGISIEQRSRGVHQATDLTLRRDSWWRPDGWIHQDKIEGIAPAGQRLAMSGSYALGWIEQQGRRLPITVDQESSGIAWPQGHQSFVAQSTQKGKVEGNGWGVDMKEQSRIIYLPPGMSLLSAPGLKSVGAISPWADRFTLLSWFGIAILAMLVRQAAGWISAAVAVVVAVGWVGSGGALLLLWLVALVAGLTLLARALPHGRLSMVFGAGRMFLAALLIIAWIPFAGQQMRLVLHPQLDSAPAHPWSRAEADGAWPVDLSDQQDPSMFYTRSQLFGDSASSEHAMEMQGADVAVEPTAAAMPMRAMAPAANKVMRMAENQPPEDELDGLGLASVGKALPLWNKNNLGKSYLMEPKGDIKDPVVLSVPVVAILRVLGILLLGWLAAKMAMLSWPQIKDRLAPVSRNWARRLALALVLVPGLVLAQDNTALPQELVVAPTCAPACASLVDAHVQASGDILVASYRLSVEHASSWTLPTVDGAKLVDVSVDGQHSWWVRANEIRVGQGQARVVARYETEGEHVQLRMSPAPLSLTHTSQGWNASTSSDGTVYSAGKIEKRQAQDSGLTLPTASPAPALVDVQRQFSLKGTVGVRYVIQRLPGNEGTISVRIQALEGESMQTSQVAKEDGFWVGNLPAGQHQVVWNSHIQTKGQLDFDLVAMPATKGKEAWVVDHSPAWAVAFDGPDTQRAGQRLPLPEESFKLKATRLPMAQGNNQRVDQASWVVEHVDHTTPEHTITMMLTLAQADVRVLTIPKEAKVLQVQLDGQDVVVQPLDGRLEVSVPGGKHQLLVKLKMPTTSRWIQRLPEVDFGGEVTNLQIQSPVRADRWLLASWGEGWGPAVMYWSELIVLLVVAVLLARLPLALSFGSAMLLILGLSTQSNVVVWLVMLVAWLAAIVYRERLTTNLMDPPAFNLLQLIMVGLTGVVVLTLGATITTGLIGARPDMSILAPRNWQGMTWWIDHTDGMVRGPVLLSVPKWVYQVLLFAWTLWFAHWIWRNTKRALAAWMRGGYWKKMGRGAITPHPAQPVQPKQDNPQ